MWSRILWDCGSGEWIWELPKLEKGGKMQGISMRRQIGHAALKDVEVEIRFDVVILTFAVIN